MTEWGELKRKKIQARKGKRNRLGGDKLRFGKEARTTESQKRYHTGRGRTGVTWLKERYFFK